VGVVKDRTGQRFGRLTVMERVPKPAGSKSRKAYWLCQCDCGGEAIVASDKLVTGETRSCGCLKIETSIKNIHGVCKQRAPYSDERRRLHSVYRNMKERCNNPKCPNYKNYGGNGVRVCDVWASSFEAFFSWAIENGYRIGLSIDRINVDGNYDPSNCRWATREEQANNKRNTIYVDYHGNTITLSQLCAITGIDRRTLWMRLKNGEDGEMLFRPVQRKETKYENEDYAR
jgi:hypothetical protein